MTASDRSEEAAELYERGGEHDSAGREDQAIPLYEQALAAGLSGELRARCLLQLGSSLRNVGRVDEAVTLLDAARREFPTSARSGRSSRSPIQPGALSIRVRRRVCSKKSIGRC